MAAHAWVIVPNSPAQGRKERGARMDEKTYPLEFDAFSPIDRDSTARGIVETAIEAGGKLPGSFGGADYHFTEIYFSDGLRLKLTDYHAGATLARVTVGNSLADGIYQRFVNIGLFKDGFHRKEAKTILQAKSDQEKSISIDGRMKIYLFEAMQKGGEKIDGPGILNVTGAWGAERIDALNETGVIFQRWVENNWKEGAKHPYDPKEPIGSGELPGFSPGNLLNFYRQNRKK